MSYRPLDSGGIYFLWPRRQSSLAPQNLSVSAPRVQPIAGPTQSWSVSLPRISAGPFRMRWMHWKYSIGESATLHVRPLDNRPATPALLGLGVDRSTTGETAISAALERTLTEGITAEASAEITDSNAARIGQLISTGHWSEAGRELFTARVKGGIPIASVGQTSWDWEGSVEPDEDGCFFGGTSKVTVPIVLDQIPHLNLPRGYKIGVEHTLTVRIGPSPAVWQRMANRIGARVLRTAIARITAAASRSAVTNTLSRAGIFAFAAAGTFGVLSLVTAMQSAAFAEAEQRVSLLNYCTGYVGFIRMQHASSVQSQQTVSRESRLDRNGNEIRESTDGWTDARIACALHGNTAVERMLLRHFGPVTNRTAIDNTDTAVVVVHQFSDYLRHHHDEVRTTLTSLNATNTRVQQLVRN